MVWTNKISNTLNTREFPMDYVDIGRVSGRGNYYRGWI